MIFKEYAKKENLLDKLTPLDYFKNLLVSKEINKNGAINLTSIFDADSFISNFFRAETIENKDDYSYLIENYGNWSVDKTYSKKLLNNSIVCHITRLTKPKNAVDINVNFITIVEFGTNLINKKMIVKFDNDGFSKFIEQSYTVLSINFKINSLAFYASFSHNLNNDSISLEIDLLNTDKAYTTVFNDFDLADKNCVINALYITLNKANIFQLGNVTIKNASYDYRSYANK